MIKNFGRMLGGVALLGGFVGCGAAADGKPTNDEGAPAELVGDVSAAATTCPAFTTTVAGHVKAGRAHSGPFFFWIGYYAQGPLGEFLGLDPNQTVTLYPVQGGGYSTSTANCTTTPVICGDGILQAGEQCDTSQLGGSTCVDLGYDEGTLSCSNACTLSGAGCRYTCGNGMRQPGEECDGPDLDGLTCADIGFTSGKVKCDSAHCKFDTSECKSPKCGNGVTDSGEVCDGANLKGLTCSDLMPTSPALGPGKLSCSPDCTTLDTSGCNPKCGDGVIQSDETCDGTNLGGKRCQDIAYANPTFPFGIMVNYTGGKIGCTDYCGLDLSQCTIPPGCYYTPYMPFGTTVVCR